MAFLQYAFLLWAVEAVVPLARLECGGPKAAAVVR
jgi:hypothetical protein